MRKKLFQILPFAVLAGAALAIIIPNYGTASSLKLNKTKLSITAGKSKTLKASTKLSSSKITWSSSNPKIVSVKKKGKKAILTAKKAGTAKITCKIGNQKEICKVTVKEKTKIQAADTLAKIKQTIWNYNKEDNVFWQVGIRYCSNPASDSYETLGIFIPGDYMKATKNEDGTYTCEQITTDKVGKYTAETAPMVLPVDTPGYSAMAAPTGYVNAAADFAKEGMIYISAGCRGRDDGAPAGVTDLKAAIRYIRYNKDLLPGNTDRIFSFGMSGGGAQSALLGATGDSELYTPYLQAIGAVETESDAVTGSMCWCPITNLDYANEAYEWNLGVTRTDLSDEMQELSDGLAKSFADYINAIGLKDSDGNVLSLKASEEGIYQAGSYYEYLKSVIETSLNHFLSDTSFPYTVSSSGGMGGRTGNGGGRFPADGDTAKGNLPDGKLLNGNLPDGLPSDISDRADNDEKDIYEKDGINRQETSSGTALSGTYETAQDYIDALNAETSWITYDSKTNTAKITSIADFVKACKTASKNVGAFDDLDKSQGENTLFGYADGSGAHFDPVMAELLKDNKTYGSSYAEDLARTDALGNTVSYRMNMYNPMYYLSDYYDGYRSSSVAKYWRIRTGINQGDTALSTEVNLSLALENYGADVDFETVWGQGHTEAERTGSSTENFIAWIQECLQ